MKNNSNIGRNLNFLIRDKKTKKYLGVTCMSSDFLDHTLEIIILVGKEDIHFTDFKTQRMINHTCIGSTLCQIIFRSDLHHWLQLGWWQTTGTFMFE